MRKQRNAHLETGRAEDLPCSDVTGRGTRSAEPGSTTAVSTELNPSEGRSGNRPSTRAEKKSDRREKRKRALSTSCQIETDPGPLAKTQRNDQLDRSQECVRLSLFVRWNNPAGKTKVNHLLLKYIENLDSLQVCSPSSAVLRNVSRVLAPAVFQQDGRNLCLNS